MRTNGLLFYAALALGLGAVASPAATVTVGGKDWEVTTKNATFSSLEAELLAQPWWGQFALATEFASALGATFGFPNSVPSDALQYGPFFAYGFADPFLEAGLWIGAPGDDFVATVLTGIHDSSRTFAVATPVPAVPLPEGGLLLLTGLAAAVGVGKRQKKALA